MRCDIIAEGIVEAAKQVGVKIPIVVRLEGGVYVGQHSLTAAAAGTNVDLGKKILSESGLAIITADNLDDAAQKATKAIGA